GRDKALMPGQPCRPGRQLRPGGLMADDPNEAIAALIENAVAGEPQLLAVDGGKQTSQQETKPPLHISDFFCHMPTGQFVFVPGRDLWPASSVNARIAPIVVGTDSKGNEIRVQASVWLARHRPVEQITWAPGKP